MNLSALATLPPGVESTSRLIAGFDQCLTLGFARLGPAQHEALEAFVGPFAGTPLQVPLKDAVAAVRRSEFVVKHFCALAAGRAAVQGAQYDALFQQACAAIGRTLPSTEPERPMSVSSEGHHTPWLASCQQWLMELALAGFAHLSADSVTPFSATLEQIQGEPKLGRTGALLTGFFVELLQSSKADGVPSLRWADLWSRAMILAQQEPAVETGATVSGTFYPLGVDVRTHAHFANLVVYGLLESQKSQRLVRVPLSSYKVDVLTPKEIWHLFRPTADSLLESLATKKSLEISNMQLLSAGDLRWIGKAKSGASFDPVTVGATAAQTIPLPPVAPLTRHPVQLAEVIHLENYSVRKSRRPELSSLGRQNGEPLELTVGDAILPLAPERLPADGEIESSTIEQSTAMTGLLRFDRGFWAVQPLSVRTGSGKKQRVVMTGESALEFCKKDKLKTLETLAERASKLLRRTT